MAPVWLETMNQRQKCFLCLVFLGSEQREHETNATAIDDDDKNDDNKNKKKKEEEEEKEQKETANNEKKKKT